MATRSLTPGEKVKPGQRWEILKGAVLKQPREVVYGNRTASVRNFEGFSLFEKRFILSPFVEYWDSPNTEIDSLPGKWYLFAPTQEKYSQIKIKIKILTGAVSKKDLIGFDNTGNICVWPSEEVLAYLMLKLGRELEGKNICELGGGMTGFAGITTALTKYPNFVLLSDGNQTSVNNCRINVRGNSEEFGGSNVSCHEIRWGESDTYAEYKEKFDLVIAADCLFFDHLHLELIQTICNLLRKEGKGILLAPRRGTSLEKFSEKAAKYFKIIIVERYDDLIWDNHILMQEHYSDSYIKDLHYPILVKLFKY